MGSVAAACRLSGRSVWVSVVAACGSRLQCVGLSGCSLWVSVAVCGSQWLQLVGLSSCSVWAQWLQHVASVVVVWRL